MARQGRERANGPYQRPGSLKWRVFYFAATGARSFEDYASEAEAIAERDAYNQAAGTRTVGEAVRDYLEHMKAKSRGRGLETMGHRLVAFLRLKDGDRPLTAINAPLARELYSKRCAEVAADTQHGELSYTKRFIDWCVGQGWIRVNPFADIKPVGEKKRGKPRLRVNGTRQYMAVLLEDPSLEATAVLTALMLGLRASEVVNRTVEDLDDNGWLLWIRNGKTENADREIEIPAPLRERLLQLVAGKAPTARIFGDMTRHALHYHTVKFCDKAGVPRVTPHGLRGSGATHAVRLGGGVEQVARALGHGDEGDTLKAHYLGGGAIESARGRMMDELVKSATPGVTGDRPTSLAGNHVRVYSSYESGELVTRPENSVTNNPNEETN